jgi:hypothetical protein
MKQDAWRRLEVNGGRVSAEPYWQLILPPVEQGYADAQIDDYGGRRRRDYRWRPGTELRLRARFSHPAGQLLGTAGFGFWNAPFGDPTLRWPALPQCAWFFFASPPGDLPLALDQPGRGWFASTLDATTGRALLLASLAPPLLLLNQFPALRRKLWPAVRRQLQISYAPIDQPLDDWHDYHLAWRPAGCTFAVDSRVVLDTPFSPRGPLGFVCWIDNQYLTLRPTGYVRWGTLSTAEAQMLAVSDLEITE